MIQHVGLLLGLGVLALPGHVSARGETPLPAPPPAPSNNSLPALTPEPNATAPAAPTLVPAPAPLFLAPTPKPTPAPVPVHAVRKSGDDVQFPGDRRAGQPQAQVGNLSKNGTNASAPICPPDFSFPESFYDVGGLLAGLVGFLADPGSNAVAVGAALAELLIGGVSSLTSVCQEDQQVTIEELTALFRGMIDDYSFAQAKHQYEIVQQDLRLSGRSWVDASVGTIERLYISKLEQVEAFLGDNEGALVQGGQMLAAAALEVITMRLVVLSKLDAGGADCQQKAGATATLLGRTIEKLERAYEHYSRRREQERNCVCEWRNRFADGCGCFWSYCWVEKCTSTDGSTAVADRRHLDGNCYDAHGGGWNLHRSCGVDPDHPFECYDCAIKGFEEEFQKEVDRWWYGKGEKGDDDYVIGVAFYYHELLQLKNGKGEAQLRDAFTKFCREPSNPHPTPVPDDPASVRCARGTATSCYMCPSPDKYSRYQKCPLLPGSSVYDPDQCGDWRADREHSTNCGADCQFEERTKIYKWQGDGRAGYLPNRCVPKS